MQVREITIINRLGLHVRAAGKLVELAGRFGCEITLIKGQREVNAKSIMGVLMLGAKQGTQLHLRAQGEDAEQALAQIEDLILRRFDEEA
jgi:phosphocarrier protein